MRGSPPQSGVPVVLPPRSGRQGAGPLDLLEEPARSIPGERILRHLFETVVQRCMRRAGRRRRLCGRCQPDRRRRQQAASVPGNEWKTAEIGPDAGRAAREYLATLDDAAFGAASDRSPKFVSPSDPAAQWTGAHKGHAFFAYATNYLIDIDHAIIVDVEATRAIRQAEVGAARTMIERPKTALA